MSMELVVKYNNLPKLAKAAPKQAEKLIQAAARDGEAYVKRSIATSPAGINGTSIPGNPPRIDIGYLVNNLTARKLKRFKWAITSAADYSALLEYGTIYMEARPFMTPMAVYLRKQMKPLFDNFPLG